MNGSPCLIELTPAGNLFTRTWNCCWQQPTRRVPCTQFGLEFHALGGSAHWWQEESCSVVERVGTGLVETLKAVTTGNLVEQVIHFEINASSSSPAELGLDLVQSYFQVATARLGGQRSYRFDLSSSGNP